MFNVESYQPPHGPFPACLHIRLFGATRIAPEPQLLPEHLRQHAWRLRCLVQRRCPQRLGWRGFRRHGYFTRIYELAAVHKAINLESQYENEANRTSVLRLTLTVRPLHVYE